MEMKANKPEPLCLDFLIRAKFILAFQLHREASNESDHLEFRNPIKVIAEKRINTGLVQH
jgi:hypothetical protein